MNAKESIIDILNALYPKTITITALAMELGTNKNNVESILKELMFTNYPIIKERQSYHLMHPILSLSAINKQLQTNNIGKSLYLYPSLVSTNTYAKNNLDKLDNGTVILAHEQTSGKGRLGRNWSSPMGGSLSMSVVIKPDIDFEKIPLLTQLTAASLLKALHSISGVKVKWPNDIILNQKKIAGILIETEFKNNSLSGIVIGIGLNTNLKKKDIPTELLDKASSIKIESKAACDPNELVGKFLTYFEHDYTQYLLSDDTEPFISMCRDKSILLDKDFWITIDDHSRKATVNTIDAFGNLVVTFHDTGEIKAISSSNISIRGDKTYI